MPRGRAFLLGIRDILPILIGTAPFGMIYGALARDAGLSPELGQAISSVIFAGSAQFLLAQLVKAGAPGFIILASVAVINLRHALYSASLAPHLKDLRWSARLFLAYLLTDEAYAVAIKAYREPAPSGPDARPFYFAGTGITLWVVWQATTALGLFVSALIPAGWQLDFALPLTFIAIVVPALRDRPSVVAAAVGGLLAMLAVGLPFKLGLIVAAVAGIAAGTLTERVLARHGEAAR